MAAGPAMSRPQGGRPEGHQLHSSAGSGSIRAALDRTYEIEDPFDRRLPTIEKVDLPAPCQDQHTVRVLTPLLEIRGHEDHAHSGIAELTDGLEDLLLGAKVDAPRRLVEQKNAGPAVEPFAQDQFLLIAARQMQRIGIETGRVEPELLRELAPPDPHRLPVEHGADRDAVEVRHH